MDMKLSCLFFIYYLFFIYGFSSLGTLSIDLGSSFIKVSVVKSGAKPIDIVLDESSERKSVNAIAFSDNKVHYGNQALVEMSFNPACGLYAPQVLMGHSYESDVVQNYLKEYDYLNITKDEDGKLVFHPKFYGESISINEAFALIINYTITYSAVYNGFHIGNIVLIVPTHYTMNQRITISNALKIIDCTIVGIIDSSVALAYAFTIDGLKFINDKPKNFMFIDFGESQITINIIRAKMQVTLPVVNFLSNAHSDKGGKFATRCLAEAIHKFYQKTNPTKQFPFWNAVQYNKLVPEFESIKKVLSTNSDILINIDQFDGKDTFKSTFQRNDYLNDCNHLNEQVTNLIDEALNLASLKHADINNILLMGGGTRTYSVNQMLTEGFNDKVLKILNTDESNCYGAALFAAKHTPGLKLKPLDIVKVVRQPIIALYEKSELVGGEVVRTSTNKTLYNFGDLSNSTKILSIKDQLKDFKITFISYAGKQKTLDNKYEIFDVDINGITDAVKGNSESISHIVRIYISLNLGSIIQINKAEVVFTYLPEKSTFEKIGSVFTNLMGSSDSEAKNETKSENMATPDLNSDLNNTAKANEKLKQEDAKVEPKKNMTKVTGLTSQIINYRANIFNNEQLNVLTQKFKKNSELIMQNLKKSMLNNDLLTLMYESDDKLLDGLYDSFSTEAERNSLKEVVDQIKSWYEESSEKATFMEFSEKFVSLKTVLSPMMNRIEELKKLTESIAKFRDLVNSTDHFIKSTFEKVPPNYLSEILQDITNLKETLIATNTTIETKYTDQLKLSPIDEPVLTHLSIMNEYYSIDRQTNEVSRNLTILYRKAMEELKIENEKKKIEEEEKAKQAKAQAEEEKSTKNEEQSQSNESTQSSESTQKNENPEINILDNEKDSNNTFSNEPSNEL